ncbi:MAG: hypothetical protein HYR84_00355 [Planctomycetes bacterium]|nr:hypothetical protein [Planctomycetota bacterium]
MNTALRLSLVLLLAVGFLAQTGSRAGESKPKEPVKKKAEPFKPIVVDSELINADLKDKVYSNSFSKTFTFKMEKGRTYQIEMSSNVLQPAIRLEDAGGSQVAQAVDPLGNGRAMLLFQPKKTEDFQIIATTPNGGALGKFTLHVKDASAYNILTVNEKLTQNDAVYAGAANKKHKLFTVNLEAGKTYQIDMISAEFDSYLFFESPDKKLLAQDDDGGGYPNARIIHKATQTGKFRVICTYFGGGGNLGNFTLTVRQTDGEPRVINPRNDKR